MTKRFSKFDFISIKRKQAPKVIKHVIKREVLSFELADSMRLARKKTAQAQMNLLKPQILWQKPERKLSWRPQLMQVGSFAIAGLILVVSLNSVSYLSSAKNASGEILGAATSAYTDLHAAGKNVGTQDFGAAQQLFDAAVSNIKIAQDKLNNFRALKWFAPQANSTDHVLKGAGFLAEAGKNLARALDLFGELKVSSHGIETIGFNDKLKANRQLLVASRELVLKASDEFNSAKSLPFDYSATLDSAKQQVLELDSILQKLVGLEDLYLSLFDQNKTYLLIFQNYDEQRATGGFIGTYGVLKTDNGTISKLKIQSIYQLDSQIYEQIAAPGPMQPLNKRWGIRDANWFADFPTSARKLLYFFEKGSETADGVISVTPKMFEDFLNLTGPVKMDQYGITLTADNFQQVVQFKTSFDYEKKLNQPKKFLSDFAPVLLDRLIGLNKDQWFEVFQIFQDNLNSRQMILYSKDPSTQKQIEDSGFAGQILNTDYDYLFINNSNLGGTKTDLSMDQSVKLQSKILSDGSVMNTLNITRKNSADARNLNYLRVLVPLGSQFVSAQGFDDYPYYDSVARGLRTDPDLAAWDAGEMHSDVFVRTETGKTEFAGWLATAPGDERSATLTYMLPFKINEDALNNAQPYSLLLQKQSGAKPFHFEGSVVLGQFKSKWLGPDVSSSGNIINFGSETNTDDFWPFLMSK